MTVYALDPGKIKPSKGGADSLKDRTGLCALLDMLERNTDI